MILSTCKSNNPYKTFNNKQAYQTRNTCIITKANQNCT